MTDSPRIALVTARDPRDRLSWSGIDYRIAETLERHVGTVAALGPCQPAVRQHLERLDRRLQRHVGTRYNVFHSILLARAYATFFEDRLRHERCDLIFAPAAATEIGYLRTRLPIVYLSDATFAAMLGYYPTFSGFSAISRFEGNHVERRAIGRAAAIIYANDWAARSATATYGAPADKLHVIPFGANIDDVPPRAEVLRPARDDRCRLLFVGKDWQRKGGDIAYDTLRHLRRMGVEATLTICGCKPPAPVLADPHVTVVPFLDQRRPAEREALARRYLDATLFLLPTRAECSAIAFSEASAFGLPIVTTDTGGVGTVVQPGINGILLPPAAGGAEYAAAVRSLLGDRAALAALRESSRTAYETRLNWDAWGASVGRVIRALLARA